MKGTNLKLRNLGIASLVLFSVFVFTGQAVAEGYLGEFCWKATDPENAHNYFILKFAVSEVGVGHYTLNGIIKGYQNDVLEQTEMVVHGNAEIVGEKIIATLVGSYYDNSTSCGDDYWGFSFMNFTIDLSTFNGTIRPAGANCKFPTTIADLGEDGDQMPVEFLQNCK